MKTVKSLLLGAAAGFVALSGAQAADLPGKAAPAEYVRICDTYGAGFFFIPGSDTCLRVGGFVRADYSVYDHTFASQLGWRRYREQPEQRRVRQHDCLSVACCSELRRPFEHRVRSAARLRPVHHASR